MINGWDHMIQYGRILPRMINTSLKIKISCVVNFVRKCSKLFAGMHQIRSNHYRECLTQSIDHDTEMAVSLSSTPDKMAQNNAWKSHTPKTYLQ